jgi:phage-related protein
MYESLKQWLSNIYEGIKGTIVNVYDGIKGTIVSIYEGIRDSLFELWQKFIEIVDKICDWIWEIIVYCAQVIWDFFLGDPDGFLWWILKIFGEWASWFLKQVPDMSQTMGQYSSPISTAMGLFSKLDKFVPLTEAVSLLGIFIVFLIVFLCVKLILKLIPTIG